MPPSEGDIELGSRALILGVRNIRGRMNVAPGKELELLLRKGLAVRIKRRLDRDDTFLESWPNSPPSDMLAERLKKRPHVFRHRGWRRVGKCW